LSIATNEVPESLLPLPSKVIDALSGATLVARSPTPVVATTHGCNGQRRLAFGAHGDELRNCPSPVARGIGRWRPPTGPHEVRAGERPTVPTRRLPNQRSLAASNFQRARTVMRPRGTGDRGPQRETLCPKGCRLRHASTVASATLDWAVDPVTGGNT
jgi:hypothetical protein